MRRNATYGALCGIVTVSCLLAACDESLRTLAGPTPNLEPTFTSIQREIFASSDSAGRASCTSCHQSAVGAPRAAGMSLASDIAYESLVGKPSSRKSGAVLVVPGDPDRSYLIQKLEGNTSMVGRRMPTSPPYLTAGQMQIIRRWIQIGAPNN